ncbi:MAG TPA: type VI immunity family protein [Archangium sp.]|uniref:type VI immunity family protein n=1 Tax=Archangium sp. TaxID=1872627 RepID=UPI002E365B3D|nr:type VI immunity family protein [Archangium sp.]HEX5754431.1 type VI immunity family protein [Archangium sp.]
MTSIRPRVRIPGPIPYTSWAPETGDVTSHWNRLIARDVVRAVFFVPRDHFDIAAGVSHALDSYLHAVSAYPAALSQYTCCDWEPSGLDDGGWELIRATLNPKEHRYAEDYTRDEVSQALKDGADPYFGIYGTQDSGFSFEYHARVPSRQASPDRASVLRVTLPTEYLKERGASAIRELALELASLLPFASGHAGLALDVAYPRLGRLDTLRPLLFRHPGFDVRDAGIRDELGVKVDGVHWMNFLGEPVLGGLGGASGLRARLHSPSTEVQALDSERILVLLGPEPEAGDTAHGQPLPAYRELARVLEPWQEPFPWGYLGDQGKSADEQEWRRWWRRFLD